VCSYAASASCAPDKFGYPTGVVPGLPCWPRTHAWPVDNIDPPLPRFSRRHREQRDARPAEADYDIEHAVVDMAVADESAGKRLSILPRRRHGTPSSSPISVGRGTPTGCGHLARSDRKVTVKSRIRSGLRRMRTVLATPGCAHEQQFSPTNTTPGTPRGAFALDAVDEVGSRTSSKPRPRPRLPPAAAEWRVTGDGRLTVPQARSWPPKALGSVSPTLD